MNPFEQEISKSLKVGDWYAIKVPVATRQGVTFLNRAPFDFIAVKYGIAFAMEAKMCRADDTNFPLDRVESHQVANLLAFSEAGGHAYVVISFRRPKLTAHAIGINDWRSIAKSLTSEHHRRSIPRSWFATDARIIQIPRTKIDGILSWDFSVLLPPTH